MPVKIKIEAKGEELVIRSASELPSKIQLASSIGLARGLLFAVGVTQRVFLSGPRPARLQAITGRLRQSISSSVTTDGKQVSGRIGSNVPYAAYHEFGFRGVEQVRAHTRAISQTLETKDLLFGIDSRRRVVSSTGEFIGFRDSRKAAAKRQKTGFVGVQFVKAHQRRVNYVGKPYLRPALDQTLPQIIDEVNKEIASVNAAESERENGNAD